MGMNEWKYELYIYTYTNDEWLPYYYTTPMFVLIYCEIHAFIKHLIIISILLCSIIITLTDTNMDTM